MSMLLGLSAAALLWWLLKNFAHASPAKLAKLARAVGGAAALVVAALLAFRGRLDMAFLLGGGGAWLLGWNAFPNRLGLGGIPFGRGSATKSPGATSRVRSATIEMALDHDSGEMGGSVLAGLFAGSSLGALDLARLIELRASCLAVDPDGARLLEAYLDRRFAAWREDAEPDPDPRGRPEPKLGAMTEQEAYEVLGIEPGAGPDDVRRAHRELMKRLHPDQGGSTYLATRVNQAKDVLLNRHR